MEVAASCIAFAQVADQTIRTIRGFIIACRDARSDLIAVKQELSDLKFTLNILKGLVPDGSETGDPLPSSIRNDIRSIIKNCLDVAKEIDDVLMGHRGRLAAMSWAAKGKQRVNSLKAVLEAHRRALNLAVDAITLAMTKSIKNDTEDILEDTANIKEDTVDIKEDTTRIFEGIASLEALIRRNIPAESSKAFLLSRYLDDLTSVAGSVCGDLSRPGTPESIPERPSTIIATEAASNDDVLKEPKANKLITKKSKTNKLKAKRSEASTQSSTPEPSPVSTPLPVDPHHTSVKKHQKPRPRSKRFQDTVQKDQIKPLAVRPKRNKRIEQQRQSGECGKTTTRPLQPVPAPVLKENLEAQSIQEPDQRFTLAGDASVVFFGPETSVLQRPLNLAKSTSFAYTIDTFLSKGHIFPCERGERLRLSDDETTLYVEYIDSKKSTCVGVFAFPSMKRLHSLPHRRGFLTNFTTDGSIFSISDYSGDRLGMCKTLVYNWTAGDEKTVIHDGYSLNVSLPIDSDRGLFLQRPRLMFTEVGPLCLYQVIKTGPGGSGISLKNVVLSDTPANVAQCAWNFSHDRRHIVSFFNIRRKPMVETWSFKDDLATKGDLKPKVQQAEKHSFSLKPHTHPDGKACACYVSSVAMASNLVVVISWVCNPLNLSRGEYFATGWSLGAGDVVFQHALGTWHVGSSFYTQISRDCKILKLSRRATSEEETKWRKSRDFKSAYLHSTLELDGPDLRLVQTYAFFDNEGVNPISKDIGRALFMSMVEPAEEGKLSSWVFDFALNLKRLDEP